MLEPFGQSVDLVLQPLHLSPHVVDHLVEPIDWLAVIRTFVPGALVLAGEFIGAAAGLFCQLVRAGFA